MMVSIRNGDETINSIGPVSPERADFSGALWGGSWTRDTSSVLCKYMDLPRVLGGLVDNSGLLS